MKLYRCEVPTIDQMNSSGIKIGYHYVVYTLPIITDRPLIGDGILKLEDNERQIIGWGYHGTNQHNLALIEAMVAGYRECRKEAEAISLRTKRDILELIPADAKRCLDSEINYGHAFKWMSELQPKLFIPNSAKQ
jgi:hypothetical protein